MKRKVVVAGFLPDDELEVRKHELTRWAADLEVYYIVKTHAVFEIDRFSREGTQVFTTYTYRDIRDVAVSVKRHFGARGKRLIAILDEAVETYFKLGSMPHVIRQPYAFFTQNPGDAIVELANYFGLELSAGELASVVESCSLDAMKKISDKEATSLKKRVFKKIWHLNRRLPLKQVMLKFGFPLPLWIKIRNWVRPYDNQTLLRPGHVSESGGASGSWVDALEAEEIETIETRYARWFLDYRDKI